MVPHTIGTCRRCPARCLAHLHQHPPPQHPPCPPHPESGGQVGDTGAVVGPSGAIDIGDAQVCMRGEGVGGGG